MRKIPIFLFGLLLFHLFILLSLQFTAWPEMVSFPYFINEGLITYKDTIHAYPPLLINILAFFYKVFGYQLWVLKAVGWGGILISDVLIFVITVQLTKKRNLAIIASFMYVILQPVLEGNMVWPDLTIVPFLLATSFLLMNKKFFWAGIIIGLAVLVKQTGIFFLGFGIFYIIFFEKQLRSLVNFSIGITIVAVPFLVSLVVQNSFSDFVNWTIIYPSYYWTKFPGYVQLTSSIRENLVLLVLFLPFAVFIIKVKKKIFQEREFLLLFAFLVAGILGVYPRFSFFHFQAALAFLVILYVYLVNSFKGEYKYRYLLFLIPILILTINFRSLVFGGSRFWTNKDIEFGQIIQSETTGGEPVYLLGLNSSIYTFADRLPNSPWLDNFGWYLEIPEVQEKVIAGFENKFPSKIFWQIPEEGNWYDIGTYQPQMISSWIRQNYMKEKEIQKGVWEWRRKN